MNSRKQERELLHLQAELLRLKIAAQDLKCRRALRQRSAGKETWANWLALAEQVSQGAWLWKAAKPVAGGKSRLLLAAAWLVWRWWKKDARRS